MMKNKFQLLIALLWAIFFFTSCEKEKTKEDNISLVASNKKIQFYADPEKYNQKYTGLVVSSITINGLNYSPKLFIDNCTESYSLPISGTLYGDKESEYVDYKINMQQYGSLDAIMNNMPYQWQHWYGRIYASDFKVGCNTLQVTESSGTQLFALTIK